VWRKKSFPGRVCPAGFHLRYPFSKGSEKILTYKEEKEQKNEQIESL